MDNVFLVRYITNEGREGTEIRATLALAKRTKEFMERLGYAVEIDMGMA